MTAHKKKQITIYRHAKPIVLQDEIILGKDYPDWVRRYNDSGIVLSETGLPKENFVFTSKIRRSIKTGKTISNKLKECQLFNEAEIPLIHFPKFSGYMALVSNVNHTNQLKKG